MADPFWSVELIWAIWAASMTASVVMTRRALARLTPRRALRLLRDERGAAYTLSYAMVLPFYVASVIAAIETTTILLAKCGTNYAAFAAARVACVYPPSSEADRLATAAAARAMTPFASGLAVEPEPTSPGARAWVAAHLAGGPSPVSPRYLLAKARYAEVATRVRLERRLATGGAAWEADRVATVEYRYPFFFAAVGWAIGARDEGGRFVYPIRSRVALRDECPKNESLSLGIRYGPFAR